jgi:hypothetical protein
LENENEVFLLTQEETEALVKQGYNEALMWAVEAIKRFPDQSPEEIIKTVHEAVSSNLNSTKINPVFVEELEPVNLADFSFKVLNGENPYLGSHVETEETVESFTSIYDALTAKSDTVAASTVETAVEMIPVDSISVEEHVEETVEEVVDEHVEVPVEEDIQDEGLSIFDMLAAKTGMFGHEKVEEENPVNETEEPVEEENFDSVEETIPENVEEDNAEEPLMEKPVEESVDGAYSSLEEEYINAAVETEENNFETETLVEDVVEENDNNVEDVTEETVAEEMVEDSETSIFDQLAAQTGLLSTLEEPEKETVDAHIDNESLTGEEEALEDTVEETTDEVAEEETAEHEELADNEDAVEEATDEVAEEVAEEEAETVEEHVEELTNVVEEDSETSIFDQLAAQTGLLETAEEATVETTEEPAGEVVEEHLETSTLSEEPVEETETAFETTEEPSETIEEDTIQEDTDIETSEVAEEETLVTEEVEAEPALIETSTEDEQYEFNMDAAVEPDNSFEELTDEEIEQGTADKLTVKNVNINRYVYENLEGDIEETSEEYENGISLDKAYSAEESGGIVNNTLLVQEFDADKKLVSRDVGGETEIEFVNKDYEPGEEYTIITETVIQKDEMENPETAKEFGGNVNISLGGAYEAPDEEASEIIPEPEVKVEVAEQISDGKPKKKKKLFGKDEEETPQYETETFIPVVEIDEEELAAQVSSEGLSREGRNIGLSGLGGGGIEIDDTAYDKTVKTVEPVEDSTSYLSNGEEEPENIPTLEEEPEEETPQMVNPNVNTRQLIKDVKIIDSL